jgi:choline dehydrogenase-like flavoprotein
MSCDSQFDFDFIVIGSGFGGSVSAYRLTTKGYRVAVLEMGRRWKPADLPRTSWSIWRWFWRPKLGLKGFFQHAVFQARDHLSRMCGRRRIDHLRGDLASTARQGMGNRQLGWTHKLESRNASALCNRGENAGSVDEQHSGAGRSVAEEDRGSRGCRTDLLLHKRGHP